MRLAEKLEIYLQSCFLLGRPHLKGVPLLPRFLHPRIPYYRSGYNLFLRSICTLGLKDVQWVCDVGANHGDFSTAASSLYPHAQVILVEPFPGLHAELEKRAQAHRGNWQLEKLALGTSPGRGTLFTASNNDTNGSLIPYSETYYKEISPTISQQPIPCEISTLDLVLQKHQVPYLDLLKIDTEGTEKLVLEGGRNVLSKTRGLMIEVSLIRENERNSNYLIEFLEQLSKLGFSIVEVQASLFSRDQARRPLEYNILAKRC